jgi:prophage regulatory protein
MDSNISNIDPNSYLRQPEVLKLVPVAASTLWKWAKAGSFPQPVKLSENCTAWRARDVLAWLDAQQQASQQVK